MNNEVIFRSSKGRAQKRLRHFAGLSKNILLWGVFGALAFAGAGSLWAQADQGSINGVVEDLNKAVVPGAVVTLTSTDTGLVLTTKSGDSGSYTFSPIKIGHYKVTAQAPGFTTTTQTGLELHVQQRLEVNLDLSVGGVTESVSVTASNSAQLQTEEASVGQEVSTQAIQDTPLSGRNFIYIAQLASGVTPVVGSRGGANGDFSANGQRSTGNNFILDGIDNNSSVVDFLNGASYNVKPPPDALAEFRVQTANFSAEFGHSAGAVVNATIKSGTNQIHGALWEYVRNTSFNAKDWNFTSIPAYHQNQFGATLGFPIIKDKLFFFGDTEASRVSAIDTVKNVYTVPTAKMRIGDFSDLLNTSFTQQGAVQLYDPTTHLAIPGNRLDQYSGAKLNPIALKILSMYPCSTATGATPANNNCIINRPLVDNTFQFDTRIDWNVSAKDQAFVRYSQSNERTFKGSPLGQLLDGGSFNDSGSGGFLSQNIALSETHIFNPSLTNEIRFGFNYGQYTDAQPNANTNESANLGIGGIPFFPNGGGLVFSGSAAAAVPVINMFGSLNGQGFGSVSYYYTTEHQNIAQLLDNVTKVIGGHTLRAGVSFQYVRFATLQPPAERGSLNFNGQYTGGGTGGIGSGFADFLLDKIQQAYITTASVTDQLRWNNSAFVQDDWKTTKNLTLNLGVRWDIPTGYRELHGRQGNFVPSSALGVNSGNAIYRLPLQNGALPNLGTNFLNNAGSRFSAVGTDNQYLVANPIANFAPRLGAAYQLSDKAVIRAGYGFFYSAVESSGYGGNMGDAFPFIANANLTAASCNATTGCPVVKSNLGNPITLETGFTDVLNTGIINLAVNPSLNGVNPDTKIPYAENYNLTAEYALTPSTSLRVGYIGSQSHKMSLSENLNNAYGLQTAGSNINAARAFPGIGDGSEVQYLGQSAYNSLQATLAQRRWKGLSYTANYTWSHSRAIGSSPIGGGGSPILNSPLVPIRLSAANTSFDARNRFTVNGNYELPVGFGRQFLNNHGPVSSVIGNWDLSFTWSAQTGTPFSVTSSTGAGYTPAVGATTTWAKPVQDPFKAGGTPPANNPTATCPTSVKNRTNWYNPCSFVNPETATAASGNIPAGTFLTGSAAYPFFGNLQGNQVYGPGSNRLNLSIFKNVPFIRESNFQFRVDVFNALNHPSFANPATTGITSAGGNITNSVAFQKNSPDSRFFQFSLKLNY